MTTLPANIIEKLQKTIDNLVAKGKGILAADESTPSITKRFAALNIPCTEDTRCAYREMLLTTSGLQKFISGVILFEETLNQRTHEGVSFAEVLNEQGIITGIKVDKGLIPLVNTENENVTQGLDGLPERLGEYKKQGACFAKWRAVYSISTTTPSCLALQANAEILARYAAICQKAGFVPIVEPEILIDGDHTIEISAEISEKVLHAVFRALYQHQVLFEYIILKTSMVIPGKKSPVQATPEQIAESTLNVFYRAVPTAVPTINFLSGGQTPEQATANLNAMHLVEKQLPWNISFSYGRALQEPALQLWLGNVENTKVAQQALYKRAKLNSLASSGEYKTKLEK